VTPLLGEDVEAAAGGHDGSSLRITVYIAMTGGGVSGGHYIVCSIKALMQYILMASNYTSILNQHVYLKSLALNSDILLCY
jgi:hypothetical protein